MRTFKIDRLLEQPIDVLNIQAHGNRTPTESFGTLETDFGIFISQHDARITDLDFGVSQLSARARQPHYFRGAKRLLVELNSVRCAVDAHGLCRIDSKLQLVKRRAKVIHDACPPTAPSVQAILCSTEVPRPAVKFSLRSAFGAGRACPFFPRIPLRRVYDH